MDKNLKDYLNKQQISYKIHEHPAVFTVEESEKLDLKLSYMHTKSLFLKSDSNFYLVCMNALKRLNIKKLESHFKLKKLRFASPEELKKELNLTPGSVSIFGMIYAKKTILVIDKEVWDSALVGFHPNINTATLEINHQNLEKFINFLNCEKHIIEL